MSQASTSTRDLRQVAYSVFKKTRRVVVTYDAEQVVGDDHQQAIHVAVAEKIADDLRQQEHGISPTDVDKISRAWSELTMFSTTTPREMAKSELTVTVDLNGLAPGALKRVFPEARAV